MMTQVSVRLLGDFSVFSSNVQKPLPASKKTRALLAFLILSGAPQRRDRLTELFWDVPDDPRGALRWSLTKIRQVLNDENHELLKADRERVLLDYAAIETDLQKTIRKVENPKASVDELKEGMTALRRQELLEGLELPDLPLYSLWLRAERERLNDFVERNMRRLIEHPELTPDAALVHARDWLEHSPYSADAANAILSNLLRLKQDNTYSRERSRFIEHFRSAEVDFSPTSTINSERLSQQKPEDRQKTAGKEGRPEQVIRFCHTRSGVSIAYASVGSGPPLVKAANWLTHLELDWNAPIWSPLFRELARHYTFVRYDERGNGLSDWATPELSQSAFVADLEAVVDALKLTSFPLLGISQGAAVSIEYACRHPERVSKLILFGGYPAGWRKNAGPSEVAEREAVMTLVRSGWGSENPAYRRIFSTTFMPDATSAQLDWFDDFQRQTTSAVNAHRFLSAFGDIDVEHLLPQIQVPTLILHSRYDQRIPWDTARRMAAMIPDARLVTLESRNHLLLEGEPASEEFVTAILQFLAE